MVSLSRNPPDEPIEGVRYVQRDSLDWIFVSPAGDFGKAVVDELEGRAYNRAHLHFAY